MIVVDTDRLRDMVRTLEVANRKIDEATGVLMQITTHDNWGCGERHQINEYIMQNRNMIQELQSKSDGFYAAMNQLSGEFVETENNIGNMFSGLEAVISKILQVNILNIVGNVLPNMTDKVNDIASGYREVFDKSGLLDDFPKTVSIPENWNSLGKSMLDKIINYRNDTGINITDHVNIISATNGIGSAPWIIISDDRLVPNNILPDVINKISLVLEKYNYDLSSLKVLNYFGII